MQTHRGRKASDALSNGENFWVPGHRTHGGQRHPPLRGNDKFVMNCTHAFWRQGGCDEFSHQVVDAIHDRRLKKLNSQHHNWIYVLGLISLVT